MESCPRCGVQNQPGRASCWNCFGPLEGASAPSQEEVQVARAPRFALRIPWKPILGVVVLAGLAYGGFKFVRGRSPATVAGSYLDAVVVNDTQRQAKLTRGGTPGLPLLPQQFKLKEFEIQETGTVSGTTAEVMANLTIKPDTSNITPEGAADLVAAMGALQRRVAATIELTREGRAWKVDQDATARRLKTQLEKQLTPELMQKLGQVRVPSVLVPGPGAPGSSAPTTPPAAPGK